MDHDLWRLFALLTLAVALTSVTGQSSCTWNKLENTNTPNGTVQPLISDLNTCLTQCEANLTNTCQYGFDWDNSSTALLNQKCFFSNHPINQYAAPNVTHYYCILSSTIAGGGSGGTTMAGLNSVCTYNATASSYSPDGTVQPGKNTLKSCQDACEASPTTCVFGFDFNTLVADDQKCWFSKTTLVKGNYPGCTHYTPWCTTATPALTTLGNASGAVPKTRSTFQGILFLAALFVFKFM